MTFKMIILIFPTTHVYGPGPALMATQLEFQSRSLAAEN